MTDSKHYLAVSGGRVYRFQPQRFTRASLATIHGVDERIAGEAANWFCMWWTCLRVAIRAAHRWP